MADLHEAVLEFEKGYDTIVGERAATLSRRQKTRVVMIRTFLVNRSILLLDDIFASVDNNTALKIFESLKKNLNGRRILISTSKANLLEKFDKIIFLVNGKVVEEGSPADLIKNKDSMRYLKN